MKEPRHDDERLSELLDGRLEGPERDELLAYLATAGEDYDVFTEASAVLLEAEQEAARKAESGIAADIPQRPEATPPSTKARGRWLRPGARRLIAFTAVLAGLVVLGTLTWRGGGGSGGSPVRLAGFVEGQGAPPDWYYRSLTVPGRGAGDGEWTPREAAQAGAYLLRLAVAIEAGNADVTRALARQIKERYDPLGGSALDTIGLRAGGPPAELNRLLEKQTDRLEERGGRDHLRVGAWIEAAHLAATRQDAAFFRRADARTMLDRAEDLSGGNEDVRRAVAEVRAALPEGGAPVWEALPTALDAVFQAVAR